MLYLIVHAYTVNVQPRQNKTLTKKYIILYAKRLCPQASARLEPRQTYVRSSCPCSDSDGANETANRDLYEYIIATLV